MRIYQTEIVRPNARLGRIIDHDPRSRAYALPEASSFVSVAWERNAPILDQGQLGSCTGNAAVGALATLPIWSALLEARGTLAINEGLAVHVYSEAEILDGGAGLPNEDQGSSGLSVAKVCKSLGYISGYQHALSVEAAHTALHLGPFLVGTDWLSDMDSPGADGVVTATGTLRGGHEYLCREYDAKRDLWWFDNSWGPTWGVAGRFAYDTHTFAALLSRQGDVTAFVPLDEPAPTPAPHAALDAFDYALAAALPDGWAHGKHTGTNAKAAHAVVEWLEGKGLS
jgi:hypothetical protein